MSTPLDIQLSFSDEDAEQATKLLHEVGASGVGRAQQRGMAPLDVVLIASIAVQTLATLVIKLLPLWKCGVVVDARGSKIVTRKDCKFPRGSVVVITKKGTQVKIDKPAGFELEID